MILSALVMFTARRQDGCGFFNPFQGCFVGCLFLTLS